MLEENIRGDARGRGQATARRNVQNPVQAAAHSRAPERKFYTMKEACALTELSYDTLKFYCNEGLIPNVRRDENNRRIFSQNCIEWIKSLQCLKNCGMSIAEMRVYMQLCQAGPGTIPERKEILRKKSRELEQKIAEIRASLDFIEWKQGLYDDILSGKVAYRSNLTEED